MGSKRMRVALEGGAATAVSVNVNAASQQNVTCFLPNGGASQRKRKQGSVAVAAAASSPPAVLSSPPADSADSGGGASARTAVRAVAAPLAAQLQHSASAACPPHQCAGAAQVQDSEFLASHGATMDLTDTITIGRGQPVFVVAEAGNNHQGTVRFGKLLIDAAAAAGADCVKFQKRTTKLILTEEYLKRPYTGSNSFGATYGEHRDALELSEEQMKELADYARDEVGILFTASAWDIESADVLERVGVPFYKMASADLRNFPLLEHVARKQKPVILSTGMASFEDVQAAVAHVRRFNSRIVVLQCTSTYPCDIGDVNLAVIRQYQRTFPDLVIGFSGHTRGFTAALGAVTLGAKVVEKHLTLNQNMRGSDHKCSLTPPMLKEFVTTIRMLERAHGTGTKRQLDVEKPALVKLGKSVVFLEDLEVGTCLERRHIIAKGPGDGISPRWIDLLVGVPIRRSVRQDTLIRLDDLESRGRAKFLQGCDNQPFTCGRS